MLHNLFKICVSVSFNMLNVLLGGKLPPFASAAVIVEEREPYLVVEHPKQTAQREAKEETGLLVRVGDLIGTYSITSDHFTSMSTMSSVYAAEVVGGALRPSIEGWPCWLDEEELRGRLTKNSRGILDDYQRYRAEQRGKHVASVS